MFAQHAIACVLCELLLELFLVFFQTLKRFLTSFSILFNFQGPVAPQPCGWRPVYCTTEVVFCQALFFRSFWTFWTWTSKKFLRTNRELVGVSPPPSCFRKTALFAWTPHWGDSLLSQPQNFSASIGSFQGLPAEALEVILLPQRLALKYNTTPPPPCQHFLTTFFHSFLRTTGNGIWPWGICAAAALVQLGTNAFSLCLYNVL